MIKFEEHLGMVYKIAKDVSEKYRDCTFDDAFQNGAIGLMKAIETFDDKKGVKFSTHAYRVVYGYALHTYYRDSWLTKNQYNPKTKLYDRVSALPLYMDERVANSENDEGYGYFLGADDNTERETINKLEVDRIMSMLTEEERELIIKIYYKDMRYTEIGKEMGMTPSGIKHREKKILEKIRRSM